MHNHCVLTKFFLDFYFDDFSVKVEFSQTMHNYCVLMNFFLCRNYTKLQV